MAFIVFKENKSRGFFSTQAEADVFADGDVVEEMALPIGATVGWSKQPNGSLGAEPNLSDEQYIIPLVIRVNQAYLEGMLDIKDWWAFNIIDSEGFGWEAIEATRKWLFHTSAHCFNILHDETSLLAGRIAKENAVIHLEALSKTLGVRDIWKYLLEDEINTSYYTDLSVDVGTKISTDAYNEVLPSEPMGIKNVQAGSFISSNFNPI